MTKWKDIYSKKETGKTWKELTRRQTAPQVIEQLVEQEKSPDFPLRYIANNDATGRVFITEVDRQESTHILGTTKQGKSKFLEMQMSMDIWMLKKLENYKAGFLFIDSTEHGGTMYKVLKYCMKKGYDKLLVIDPHHIKEFGYVVPINPLDYDAPAEAMASHIADSIRVLWGTKDFKDEAVITKYAPYLIEALHAGRYTIPDIECFIVPSLIRQREQILNNENLRFIPKVEVKRIYTEKDVWKDVQPTFRRFEAFRHSILKFMLGSQRGVDFEKLIKEGWIILCNLHKSGVYDIQHQRLLGTILINEIVRAKERMHGNTVPFHIYIDEFGLYATQKIPEILYYARHLHLYLTLAHHGYAQIPEDVAEGVDTAAKFKVLFYTLNHADLTRMVRMLYGGDIDDRQAKYVLTQLKRQQAAIKVGKRPTQICSLRDWPDADISDTHVKEFLREHFKSNSQHYRRRDEVWEEITNKFAHSQTPKPFRRNNLEPSKAGDSPASKPRKGYDRKATGGASAVKEAGASDTSEPGQVRKTEGVQISWELLPDSSNAGKNVQRRRGEKKQGDKPQGEQGKP